MTDTIDALLREQAARHGAKTAIVDPGERISFSALDAATAALGTALVGAGIGKGVRVGVLMPNGVTWARIAFALTRIGAELVPLSTLLSPRELDAQLRTASVRHLISVEEFRGHRYLDGLDRSSLPALREIHVDAEVSALAARPEFEATTGAMSRGVRPADPLAIMFTSGSSGMPKGVRHSHGSAIGAVRSGLAARCIDADTRLYLPMPFFWVGGFGGGLLSALVAGATLVTEPAPQPETTLRLLAAERVTLFRGWPEQAEALARHTDAGTDLSALRPGSLEALLPPDMRAQPGARARLFGMTESFGPYCGYPADTDMPASAWGSCGRPFDGMQVRVVDPDSGDTLPAGAVGMICIRGPHVLRGICRRADAEVFTTDLFYPTGDLGRLDEDGFLFFHGRCDDMFKVSGATVYPSEVQEALRTIDGVRAAYVTRVAGKVGAAVVCAPTLTEPGLRAAAKSVLSSFKVPTVWKLLDDEDAVPRGATGKVDIARLTALLET